MRFIIFVCLLLLAPTAFSHGDGEASPGEKLRVLWTAPAELGFQAWVVVREGGHLWGQTYQVELRVSCDKSRGPREAEIKDSFSVCDLDPSSVVMNRAKTAIALKTKMADLKFYEDGLQQGQTAEPRCAKATQVQKFSLKQLCDK